MEPTTSFDLNQAIQKWRENLGQSPAFRSENLFELESHLRDSVATLQRQGLSDEEALLIATKRLGSATSLESEFAKRNVQLVWLDRALWTMMGIYFWMLASSVSYFLLVVVYAYLPEVNSWLNAFQLAQVPTTVPALIRTISFPIMLWAGASMMIKFHRWFQKRGNSPFEAMQENPKVLTAIFACLGIAPTIVGWLNLWFTRTYGPEDYSDVKVVSVKYSIGWTYGTQILYVVIFSALVLVIARKRQRLSRA